MRLSLEHRLELLMVYINYQQVNIYSAVFIANKRKKNDDDDEHNF